jgi:hypothetical protein
VYINKQRLNAALSVLYEEEIHSYYSGYFTYLLDNVRSTAFLQFAGLSTTMNVDQLDKRVRIVHMDLLNLATVSIRLILQQNLRGDKCEYRIGNELWRFFGSADIDLFFSKYRSIFGNIAQVITMTITKKPRGTPTSFNHLLTWLEKYENQRLIDGKYVKLMKSCDWFKYIKTIRDDIEHYAAETNVDYDSERVLFKVSALGMGLTHLPEKNLINILEITQNNGFSNFELFAGIYLGYLIWFLEELSKLIYQEFKPHELDKQCKSYHPGFQTIRTWIECATKIENRT